MISVLLYHIPFKHLDTIFRKNNNFEKVYESFLFIRRYVYETYFFKELLFLYCKGETESVY